MNEEVLRAHIVTVLEKAITDTGLDEENPLNRAVVIFQEDGTIGLATWGGNAFLITVKAAHFQVV